MSDTSTGHEDLMACFRCQLSYVPHISVATDKGEIVFCMECTKDLCAAFYFETEGFVDLAEEKRAPYVIKMKTAFAEVVE